jgi:hypothetical protein
MGLFSTLYCKDIQKEVVSKLHSCKSQAEKRDIIQLVSIEEKCSVVSGIFCFCSVSLLHDSCGNSKFTAHGEKALSSVDWEIEFLSHRVRLDTL